MLIHANEQRWQLETCRLSAPNLVINDIDARELIDHQIDAITRLWPAICEEAELSIVQRTYLWRRQFLNDYAF